MSEKESKRGRSQESALLNAQFEMSRLVVSLSINLSCEPRNDNTIIVGLNHFEMYASAMSSARVCCVRQKHPEESEQTEILKQLVMIFLTIRLSCYVFNEYVNVKRKSFMKIIFPDAIIKMPLVLKCFFIFLHFLCL